jgi:hypothetical protein
MCVCACVRGRVGGWVCVCGWVCVGVCGCGCGCGCVMGAPIALATSLENSMQYTVRFGVETEAWQDNAGPPARAMLDWILVSAME